MGFHVFEATVPPPPLPDNKVRRGYYTRSVLCEAVKQVMLGAMTVTQASRHFKIPRTTIQKHFSKAREQHNLKELYIRRMKAAEKGLIGRVPESDLEQRLSEHGTACLLSYGVDVWPSSSESTPPTIHWRQQPVKIDLSSTGYFSQDTSSYSYENEIVVAEQCEVTSDDVKYFRSTSPVRAAEEENEPVNAGLRSYSSEVVNRPSTRVVLRREGSEEVVKVDEFLDELGSSIVSDAVGYGTRKREKRHLPRSSTGSRNEAVESRCMASRKVVATLAKPELYPLYLYKRILRLHYGLPPPARLMGDTYVKDEFRRHKDANAEHTAIFLNEWTSYCVTLSKQLSTSGIVKGFIGKDLDPEKLDSFAEEQLRQLLDLKLESERMKADLIKQSEDSNSSESAEEKRPHVE